MTSTIKPELLDELLAGVSSPEELMGDAGLFRQLKKALMERALGGEPSTASREDTGFNAQCCHWRDLAMETRR
jgi:hypothetical protein